MYSRRSEQIGETFDTPVNLSLSSFVTEEGQVNGGFRQWNAEHEAILRRFYAPGSPIFVDPLEPNQHAYHLEELGFASRSRRTLAIEDQAKRLGIVLNDDPDYLENRLRKWATFTAQQREDFIVTALADVARVLEKDRPPAGRCEFANARKLTPDVTLAALCPGEGLSRFFKLIAKHVIEPANLATHPIPNEQVFRKIGISQPNPFPLSMADRAFIEEKIIRRHTLLFYVTFSFLDKLEKVRTIG